MKLRTKIIGVAACAFALCVALAGCASAPAGNDAANFQGDWILSSGTVDGQEATEETMAQAQEMGLSVYLQLNEGGSNLSGGQRQRLALARALLHDSPVYIFDEATSNIDVESENDIMAQIQALAGKKTVILISHRLANVTAADNIYVLDHGSLAEQGTHEALLAAGGTYARLWTQQQELENYGKEEASHA